MSALNLFACASAYRGLVLGSGAFSTGRGRRASGAEAGSTCREIGAVTSGLEVGAARAVARTGPAAFNSLEVTDV